MLASVNTVVMTEADLHAESCQQGPAWLLEACPLPRSTLGLNLGSLLLPILSWFTRPRPGFFLTGPCVSPSPKSSPGLCAPS